MYLVIMNNIYIFIPFRACVIVFKDIARIGVHAQTRFLPPGHEAGESTMLRSRACQNRRFWFGQGD